MASINFIAFIAIFLVSQSLSSAQNSSPWLDELCKEVECGKGTCKASTDYNLNFICECNPGWIQTRYNTTDDLRFLPCVIPNCSLDYSCPEAPPPAPEVKQAPTNISLFDPCYWAYCGQGSCTQSLRYGHKCECKQGYTNLLDTAAFPCFSQCVLGQDCASLGISVSKDTGTPNNPNSANKAILSRNFLWLTILIMSVAMVSST